MRLSPRLVLAAMLVAAACDDDPTGPSGPTPSSLSLQKIGTFQGGGAAAAEITAYDPGSRRLFVVNGALGTVDVLDLSNPASPARISTLQAAGGGSINSVAVHDGLVAIAVEAPVKTSPGTVALYRASTLQPLGSATVGALPDMLAFTPDGRYVLVANEGEPNDAYTTDPEGSVSIVDVRNESAPTVRTAGFGGFNGQVDQLRTSGVRIYGPNASVAQDLEPEYVTVSEDGRTAWVTLQENNAMAIVDIRSATVTRIVPLGYKNHGIAGNALDASDRDGTGGTASINIRSWPVLGMYQPDAIASYRVNGATYLVTANEGDARDWAGLREEARVGTLTLNGSVFTDAACGGPCNAPARLGRLNVTTQTGRNPATGQYDALYAFGARSFSIWTEHGQLVWDSGSELEERTQALPNVLFNASNTGNALDDRSDNKGPEPEGVVVAQFGRKTFAFIGLERTGGVMVYDVTEPMSPSFVTYASSRAGAGGDLGPEGLAFVSADDSPTGVPLLIVGNEVSGTTAIYQVGLVQ